MEEIMTDWLYVDVEAYDDDTVSIIYSTISVCLMESLRYILTLR